MSEVPIRLTSHQKADMMKSAITHMYSHEGRSKSYISKLLEINRKTVADKIKEWGLLPAPPKRHATPRVQKLINQHKKQIIDMLDSDITPSEICRELHLSRDAFYKTYVQVDLDIYKANVEFQKRSTANAELRRQHMMDRSSRNYDYEKMANEIWKPILGYPNYEVSNYGRVRAYAKSYDSWYLLSQQLNNRTQRLYVKIIDKNGKPHNLLVARLVGFNFCEGHSTEKNTINHIDGNPQNNHASNLEWLSQSAKTTR